MDRFALIWHKGHYIPVRESELPRLGDPKVDCTYVGHAAGAHTFAQYMTEGRLKAKPMSEAGLAIERMRKIRNGGFSPLVPADSDSSRKRFRRG